MPEDREVEQYSDGTPVEGGYLDQICQGKYYNMPEELKWKDMEDKYQNAQRIVDRYRYFCETHAFLGESFPNLNIDFGPGSLAAYLGSDIGFKEDTVWFKKCLDSWTAFRNCSLILTINGSKNTFSLQKTAVSWPEMISM